MSFVLGIDIGTSFSAAAVARLDGAGQPTLQVLNLGLRGGAVPSVIFLGEDGQVLVGEAAERRGTTHPDRLVREFKRRVGDAVPIVVGDLFVAPEDIVATMARWVVDRAQEREGELPAAIAIAHPAGWGGYKKDLIRQALAGVGLAEVTLVSEPEAAAVHYASQKRIDDGSTIAVYDLGGGTFDAAVLLKSSAESFRTLGSPEGIERLGGADFDQAVFRHVAASAADALSGLDTSDPGVLMALARLRRECTEAKEVLSTDSEASIPVLLPGRQGSIRLVRSEFEAMIDDGVQQTIGALKRALQAADTDAEDLDAILLIGGSSRIPLVAQLLSAEFNRPIAIDADPKASISLGAAFSVAAMLAPAAAGAQAAPDSPATPEDVSAAEAAAGETAHGHGFGTDAGIFAPAAAAKPPHSRTGARMAAVAATVATLTILTATAAQSPADMNPLAAGAAGAQAAEEEGWPGTAPVGGAAPPEGAGAGGPAGIQALDGSGPAPITDNWQAVDADADPATGAAPGDGTAGAGNNDGGKAAPANGSGPGTNASRPDSPSSPSTTPPGTEPNQSAQEPTAAAQQPDPPATGPAPATPAPPPATQPPPTTSEPPVTPAPDVPQTPVPQPPVPEQSAPAPEPPAPAPPEQAPPEPAPPEPAPPEPAPPAPTVTEPAATEPAPSAPAPETPPTEPAPAPEG